MAKKPRFDTVALHLMKKRGLTPYRLHQICLAKGHKVSQQTILNYCAGKSVTSDTLAAVFDALDLIVLSREDQR